MSVQARLLTGSLLVLALIGGTAARAGAEILVRWDQDRIPPPQSLGVTTVVMPAANAGAIRRAIEQGYRVLVEVPSSVPATFKPPHRNVAGVVVTGSPGGRALEQLRQQPAMAAMRLLAADERGKWPHIRTNWVTRTNDVLVVTNRSAQPWIENNAALIRIMRSSGSRHATLLTYPWKPITLADVDEGPALENYLVAIAEAGSFGGDLLLPLHPRLQRGLLLGEPVARQQWTEIRRHLEFYAWNVPGAHTPIANVAVVTAQPAQHYEVLNLLLRHNVPFELIAPESLASRPLDGFGLVIVLDPLQGASAAVVNKRAGSGGTAVYAEQPGEAPWRAATAGSSTDELRTYVFGKGRVIERLKPIADPDAFALEVRQLLGRDGRVLDIWNGITVLAAPYQHPDGSSVVVTALNYAHQPIAVQLRVRGTFAVVHYESPEERLMLLPHQHRGGYTEFSIPALRVGARMFLSERLDPR
jgi:hypothetical protein